MDLASGSSPKTAPKRETPPRRAPEATPAPAPKPTTLARDPWEIPPRDFLTEIADEGANHYRVADATVELVAGLYSDGRIRLADQDGHRFAGALIGGHADLLELQRNEWSEVFLRVTPTGRMQLELRGGPYDAHVLTCEPMHE